MVKKKILLISAFIISLSVASQQFETPQTGDEEFEKVKVRVGADFAMQYQALNHSADSSLIPLGSGINLPTANLNLEADLAKGINVKLITYLSSRHHIEAWVKGGYLVLNELPFINSNAVDRAMDYLTLKIGVMEINYGDAHFRRSDNGYIINNPFVENYIMDAFTTAPAFELMFRNNGFLLLAAVGSGTLKPAIAGYNASSQTYTAYDMHKELAYYWKAGYDKEINEDLRIRATLSGYHCQNQHFGSLYYGERTGSRYYMVMNRQTFSADDVDPANNHTSGRWGPGFTDKDNSLMTNLFAKFKGLEVFGTFETTKGTIVFGGANYKFSQFAAEALYRFGKQEQFYGGARYNFVNNDADESVNRIQIGGGWFLIKSILLKLEYVNQKYNNFISLYGKNAIYNGIMVEATISF